MSTVRWALVAILSLAAVSAPMGSGQALELGDYKNDLFAYPTILSEEDGGAFLKVDYQELRDINDRDEIPERRARGRYVSLKVKRDQATETIETGGQRIDVVRVGAVASARFAVIFIHGRGGDRRLGANDYSFGGNFNRLKNLAVANGGTYFSPSVARFDSDGVAAIAALIDYIRTQTPGGKIVLACASMGSQICWGIARQAVSEKLIGMMVMGGIADPDYAKSLAFKNRLPLFFSHGSADSVYPAQDQVALFKSLLARKYPTRFVLFETGSHGTPIRMTDWRDSLNWLLR